ncbi:hypothetical protein Taro_001937 [Colocasia esculenta]|uniref:Uncharacterized protein n=1 Tax=Colocasia esculenta TaxID=4460 RepID=A0A843THN1_COLES|nr:hypothetical protein [Colocasia esculenta]
MLGGRGRDASMPAATPSSLPMPSSLLCISKPRLETLEFYRQCLPRTRRGPSANGRTVTMRDRSKNRRPLQKGRNLSIEAIQAVQALKRARFHGRPGVYTGGGSPADLDRVLESKVRRLIKFDMMAVLGELQQQNEAFLALQVEVSSWKRSFQAMLGGLDRVPRRARSKLVSEPASSNSVAVPAMALDSFEVLKSLFQDFKTELRQDLKSELQQQNLSQKVPVSLLHEDQENYEYYHYLPEQLLP